jgi:hypothetical protein
MKPRIDLDKVEAALRRAAKTAVEGSREERAGKFTAADAVRPLLQDGRSVPPADAPDTDAR